MKTEVAKAAEVKRDWYIVDAQDAVLGRLSTQIASVLRGKNKVLYTPSVDTGDFVIVVNAEKIALTGRRWPHEWQKTEHRHGAGSFQRAHHQRTCAELLQPNEL